MCVSQDVEYTLRAASAALGCLVVQQAARRKHQGGSAQGHRQHPVQQQDRLRRTFEQLSVNTYAWGRGSDCGVLHA
jgi:hypothetical protein